MNGVRQSVIKGGLEALYFSGAHALMRPFVGGRGVILTLHSVRPPRLDSFQPNRGLEITPAFLEDVVRTLRRCKFDFVGLDEMHRRLTTGEFGRRFVCFTFDDGYRDNREWAYPILKRYEVPFTIYIPTSFPDHLGELWWLALEAVIATHDRIGLALDGQNHHFSCATTAEKCEAFATIYWKLRMLPHEEDLRYAIRDLARRYGVDIRGICRDLCMNWPEVAEMARDPLVTIGAHSVNHFMLRKLDGETARKEMQASLSIMEAALGTRPRHLAYPIGDVTSAGPREFRIAAELGLKTAATTRPGVLFPEHKDHLFALPRVSLNGEYQQLRYVKVLVSGAGTAMWNGFRRVNAA